MVTRKLTINGRNEQVLTTVPVIDLNSEPSAGPLTIPHLAFANGFTRTSASPIVIPQIADGDGSVTEFILLNTGVISKTTLSFFDNEGRQLAVGK